MNRALHDYGGPSVRSPLRSALATYVSAWAVLIAANGALVHAAATILARGRSEGVNAQSFAFARSVPGVLWAGLVSSAALGLVAVASARLHGPGIGKRLRIGPSKASIAGASAAAAGTLALSLASGSLADVMGLGDRGSMDAIAQILALASVPQIAASLITMAILPALAEEVLFRGLLQGLLVGPLGRWTAIAITAACFGLVHMDAVQGTLAAILGLFLGWTAERLGGIGPGVLAHAINNAVFILTSVGCRAGCPSRGTLWMLLSIGLGIWLAATMVLRRPVALVHAVPARASRT
ncbi:MAG: CPBP family intramembrane glutamic endopeptidase [Polyangiaceae bacterium]